MEIACSSVPGHMLGMEKVPRFSPQHLQLKGPEVEDNHLMRPWRVASIYQQLTYQAVFTQMD